MKRLVIATTLLMGLAAEVGSTSDNNPFGLFHHRRLGRYFTDGKRGFHFDAAALRRSGGRMEVSLDDGPFVPFDKPVRFSTEGRHIIRYRVVDKVGNEVMSREVEFYVDNTPPTTVMHGEVPRVNNILLVRSADAVRLTATDELSDVRVIEISHDGRTFVPYEDKQNIFRPGRHRLHYRAIDNVGNAEPVHVVEYAYTTQSPSTILKISPESYDMPNQRYVGVGHSISFESKLSIVPIKAIHLSLDGRDFEYKEPISLSESGEHELEYYAEDMAGNREAVRKAKLHFDHEPPRVSYRESGSRRELKHFRLVGRNYRLTLEARDDASGVKRIDYSIDDKPFTEYKEPLALSADGLRTIAVKATDNVGNRSDTLRIRLLADVSPPRSELVPAIPFKEEDGHILSSFPNLVAIHAKDNLSGVQSIQVSVNDSGFSEYKQPIELDWRPEHKIMYRAVDALGNEEPTRIVILKAAIGNKDIKLLGTGKDSDRLPTPPKRERIPSSNRPSDN